MALLYLTKERMLPRVKVVLSDARLLSTEDHVSSLIYASAPALRRIREVGAHVLAYVYLHSLWCRDNQCRCTTVPIDYLDHDGRCRSHLSNMVRESRAVCSCSAGSAVPCHSSFLVSCMHAPTNTRISYTFQHTSKWQPPVISYDPTTALVDKSSYPLPSPSDSLSSSSSSSSSSSG